MENKNYLNCHTERIELNNAAELIERIGYDVYLEPESKDDGNVHGYYKLMYKGAEIINGGTDEDMYADKCSRDDFAASCLQQLYDCPKSFYKMMEDAGSGCEWDEFMLMYERFVANYKIPVLNGVDIRCGDVVMVMNGDASLVETDDEMEEFLEWINAAVSVINVCEENEEEQEHARRVLDMEDAGVRELWGEIYRVTSENPNESGYFSLR